MSRALIGAVLTGVVVVVIGFAMAPKAFAAEMAVAVWIGALGAALYWPGRLASKLLGRPVGLGESLIWSLGTFLAIMAVLTVLGSTGVLILDSQEKEYRQECMQLGGSNRGCQKEYYARSDAVGKYSDAIAADPGNALHYRNRGNEWYKMRKYDRAVADYSEALRIEPDDAESHVYRGNAWQYLHDHARAIADYSEVIRLNPAGASAYDSAAWLLATTPTAALRNGERAVAWATRAAELTQWKSAVYLDTLSAAYAEAGNFTEAVRWEEKALADAQFAKAYGDEARQRLELYRKQQPYRIR